MRSSNTYLKPFNKLYIKEIVKKKTGNKQEHVLWICCATAKFEASKRNHLGLCLCLGGYRIMKSIYIDCLIFSKMLTTDTASPVRVSYGWFVREFKVSLGLYSQLQRHRLTGIIIPIINPRQSDDPFRFIIGIPIPIRWCLLGEYRPWSVLLSPLLCCMQHHVILDVS